VSKPKLIASFFGLEGCFWGVELTFQRVPGVTKTEVGYSQGNLHEPTYEDVCSGITNHNEVVRVQYNPSECKYEDLLDVFWARHDPTMLNRQVSSFCCCGKTFILSLCTSFRNLGKE
jgi:methionine-S-sulfoxide reductase